jgi:hypothetical protein
MEPTVAEPNVPERLFYSRRELSQLFNLSLPILQEYIDQDLLTPVRLSGRQQGRIYFDARQVMKLRDGIVAGTIVLKPPKKKKTEAKPTGKVKRRA